MKTENDNSDVPIYRIAQSIKMFNGEISEWPAFKRRIETLVIDRKGMSDISKMALISGLLKGKPSTIWDSCETSGMQLNQSWKKLAAEFEDVGRINLFIQSTVLKMVHVGNKYDFDNLAKIETQVSELRNALIGLGPHFSENTSQIVWRIATKFWSEESDKIISKCQSLEDLLSRIKKAQLDAVAWAQRNAEIKSKSVRVVGTAGNKPSKTCFLCDKPGHFAIVCRTLMNAAEKRKIVNDKNLCWFCLWPGHKAKDCRKKESVKCLTCNGNHPTPLHDVNFNESINVVTMAEVRIAKNGSSVGKFQCRIGASDCEVLIDSGADVSIIPGNLVATRNRRTTTPIKLCGFDNAMYRNVNQESDVVLSYPNGEINLVAYVSDTVPKNSVIIGKDFIYKMFKKGYRVWHTVFGDVDLESMKVINVVTKCDKKIVKWNENTDPEDVEEGYEIDLRMERLDNGRFIVNLPFFSNQRPPNNFNKALNNLNRLQIRLFAKGLFDQYETELMKFVENGHAEIINDSAGYFIPHHEVERPEATTTKFRIVLNASFGSNSLNELLWKGIVLNMDTLPHLLRVRMKRFMCVSDLQKAFLQIVIKENDRKYLRFLWKKRDGDLVIMQMVVLPFGVVSAPAILTQVIASIINGMSRKSSSILENSSYMDDLLVVTNSESELLYAMEEAQSSFLASGFILHKLVSNSTMIRDRFKSESNSCKLLGLVWNNIDDTLNVKWRIPSVIDTKRKLLSFIGQLFDPLGFCEPVKLLFRFEFASIHTKEWDELLDDEVNSRLKNLMVDMEKLNELSFPRQVERIGPLSCFVDASGNGYGYAIFIGNDLFFGKSKIAPRSKTIVDLELLSLLEGTKAVSRIVKLLNYDGEILMFTDSLVNIHRLKSSPNAFPIKVARRMLAILMIAGEIQIKFHHISGSKNPADLFSRGCRAGRYINSKIWKINIEEKLMASSEPIATKLICTIKESIFPDSSLRNWMDKCGTLSKMSKWSDRILKWMERATGRVRRLDAVETVYRIYQQSETKHPDDCFEDKGLIRFKSRDRDNFPVWIPGNSSLAVEMLTLAHRKSLHRGRDMSLAMVANGVRIVGARRLMKKLISGCLICRMIRGNAIIQPFGPLHDIQKRFMKPFECIMMDAFGPLKLSNGAKCYGLVVLCRTTKALKLAVLEDLSESSLANALINVWNLVGFPLEVWSDNGTNFLAVRDKLEKMAMSGKISAINWKTSTPSAPWMNGAAERMVRLVKECLCLLPKKVRSLFVLSRSFNYVEHVINQRPVVQNEGRYFSAFELCTGRTMNLMPMTDRGESIDDAVGMLFERTKFIDSVALLWISQYLNKIAKVNSAKPVEIKVGDWLLVPGMLSKRCKWPVGQVTGVVVGSDGICRSAKIRCMGKDVWRPLNKLVWIARSGAEETVAEPLKVDN
uniref:Uncharacterized protein LOC113795533 n=1 Tax=Dermatophagoides pteronyssinus TaxID=6956 RepID=A0A6P6Y803_DERPT|nr:uncharacterized protein LOC113795533 [Dermatophagoides pteronyssinus]